MKTEDNLKEALQYLYKLGYDGNGVVGGLQKYLKSRGVGSAAYVAKYLIEEDYCASVRDNNDSRKTTTYWSATDNSGNFLKVTDDLVEFIANGAKGLSDKSKGRNKESTTVETLLKDAEDMKLDISKLIDNYSEAIQQLQIDLDNRIKAREFAMDELNRHNYLINFLEERK